MTLKNGGIEEKTTDEKNQKNIRRILADNIEFYRTDLELSRGELAAKIGVSEASIGQYERAERTPSLESLVKLAEVFGIRLDSLIAGVKPNWLESVKFLQRIGFEVRKDLSTDKVYVYALKKMPRDLEISTDFDYFMDFDDGTNIKYTSSAYEPIACFSSSLDFLQFIGFIRSILFNTLGVKYYVNKWLMQFAARENFEVPELILLERSAIFSQAKHWTKSKSTE